MTRLAVWWQNVRDSLWLYPSVMAVTAFLLSFITLWLDGQVSFADRTRISFIFSGGSSGARGVLSAIATSLMTVTGTVFSITIVALQLASSQFTPRVLRAFTRDRGNQLVLGILIGTFTYALLVLRADRSEADDRESFVPAISVSVAVALALLSIGAVIFFIHHAARSIQAATIIDEVADDTLAAVDRLFPTGVGEPAPAVESAVSAPAGPCAAVVSPHGGYLQAIDDDALFELAKERRLTVRMEHPVGGFVLPGETIASVWPRAAVDDAAIRAVRTAHVLGQERTIQQDAAFGVRQLVDIAVKALSPSVNDPTTAMHCIDRLGAVLVRLGGRELPAPARRDANGRVVLIARRDDFDRVARLAFDQVRHYGAADATVVAHLLTTIERVTALVPLARREPLYEQARAALTVARDQSEHARDERQLLDAGRWLHATTTGRDGAC